MTYDRRRKKDDGADRRRWPRLKPADLPFIKKVEFSRGSKIEIINISRGGLLLETESRLGPDLKVEAKIVTTEGIFKVKGTTLRSWVFSLKGAPRYRTAVVFKDPFELMDDAMEISGDAVQEITTDSANSGVSETNEDRHPAPDNHDNEKVKNPAVLTVIAGDDKGVSLNETFKLNDW